MTENEIFTFMRCPLRYKYKYVDNYPECFPTPELCSINLEQSYVNGMSSKDALFSEALFQYNNWLKHKNKYRDSYQTNFKLGLFRIAEYIYELYNVPNMKIRQPYEINCNDLPIITGEVTYQDLYTYYDIFIISPDFQKSIMEDGIILSRFLLYSEYVYRAYLHKIYLEKIKPVNNICIFDTVNNEIIRVISNFDINKFTSEIRSTIKSIELQKEYKTFYKSFSSSCGHDCGYISLCINGG